MGRPNKIKSEENKLIIADMLASGATKADVMAYIKDVMGINTKNASKYYHDCIKSMIVPDDLLTDYKKTVQQQNFTRLEKIVKDSIEGNTADKKVAIQAIDTLNKMAGAYEGNSVTIANDKEIIHIEFDK